MSSKTVHRLCISTTLIITLAALPAAMAGPAEGVSETFAATCVKVVDGDTLIIDCGGERRTVELAGIDAPELGQPLGKKIRQFVRRTVKGQELEVAMVDGAPDQARVRVNGRDLSSSLAGLGLAWPADDLAADDPIHDLVAKARSHPAGLWTDENPQPPWEYRELS